MTSSDWLAGNVFGFSKLNPNEREALFHFMCLWSFFERKVCDTDAKVKLIRDRVTYWGSKGKLRQSDFQAHLDYFRDRYVTGGTTNTGFDSLHWGQTDGCEDAKDVLEGRQNGLVEIVTVLLLIVRRLRNNLFHGTKWRDHNLRDQQSNFDHANELLMKACDVHCELDATIPNP